MEILTHEITLGFSNETGILNIPISQRDVNRIISIGFTDYGEEYEIPQNTNVFLKARKPDGTEINTDEFCSIIDNKVQLQIFEQLSIVNGTVQCEIILSDENGTHYTSNHFNLIVNKSVHNDENLRSSDTYKNLTDILLELKSTREYLDTNEASRIENENQRILSETQRTSNENQRIADENERKNTFSTVLDTAKSYSDAAKQSSNTAKLSEVNAENSALESESWAHGKTGIRENEDTNNSEFWCKQSEHFNDESKNLLEQASALLDETNRKIFGVLFYVTDNGELMYESEIDIYNFTINDNTGELEYFVL